MSESITNLDSLCASHGYQIVYDDNVAPKGELPNSEKSSLENTITKSLGVLQDNGIYAFFLYLEYRKGDKGAIQIKDQALKLLCHTDVNLLVLNNNHFLALQQMTNELDNLLLSRQLLEQVLTYARYHAKALRGT